MGPQRRSALIEGDRLFESYIAAFQLLDDGFEFLERVLEGELWDVGVIFFAHCAAIDEVADAVRAATFAFLPGR